VIPRMGRARAYAVSRIQTSTCPFLARIVTGRFAPIALNVMIAEMYELESDIFR